MSHMSQDDLDATEVLHDFITLLLDHRERGGVRELSWYLERFPGNDGGVAREFIAITESSRKPADDLFAGRYEILRELGRGGQGVVSLARDTRLDRTVALKTIDAFGRRLERLRREAEIASSLDHPGICSIFEANFGHTPPYVAMRFIEGKTLAHLIAERRAGDVGVEVRGTTLPLGPRTVAQVERVLATIEHAARALHAAHARGVVHRDIKPGNIIITPAGDPVILDFGLARLEDTAAPSITFSGEALGTPAYMSPEQILGERPDRTADVYALGVTLYECLTLVQPFDGPSRSQIESAVLNTTPSRAASLNRALTRDVDAVLSVALERDAAHRYATAEHFAEDLRRLRCKESIVASPPGMGRRVQRWIQRNPGATLVMTVFAALIALLGYVNIESKNREQQRTAQLLGREAIDNAELRPDYAYALAGEASRLAPNTQQSNDALLRALAAHRETTFLGEVSIRISEWAGSTIVHAWEDTLLVHDGETRELRFTLEMPAHVTQASLCADGRRLLVGDRAGRVALWDLVSREELARFEHTEAPVEFLTCRWESERVFMGDAHGRLVTWDLSGGAVSEIHDYDARVSWDGCLNGDGTRLLSFASMYAGVPAGTVAHVWDTSSGRMVHALDGHTEPIIHARFSRDSRWIATASRDGTVRVWDTQSGDTVATLQHPGKVLGVSFSGAGNFLATCCDPGDLAVETGDSAFVWDWKNDPDRPRAALKQPGGRSTYAIEYSPDGSRIATAALNRHATLWSAETMEALDRVILPPYLAELCWAPGGEALATMGYVWGFERHLPYVLRGHDGPVLHAQFSSDARQVVTAAADGTARIWDVASGGSVATLPHGDIVRWAGFSPDGSSVLTGSDDGYARLWKNGVFVTSLGPHEGGVSECMFIDDERIVTASSSGEVRLWSVAGDVLRNWTGHVAAVECVRQVPGSEFVVSSGADRSVRLWSYDSDAPVWVSSHWDADHASGGGGAVFDVAVAEDGRSLLTVSQDQSLRRISLDSAELLTKVTWLNFGCIRRLPDDGFVCSYKWGGSLVLMNRDFEDTSVTQCHANVITEACVSSLGFVLSTSADGTAMLHRVEDDQLVPHMRLTGHAGAVSHGAFSSDGKLVVTASRDGTAGVWPVFPAELPLTPRQLTEVERKILGLTEAR